MTASTIYLVTDSTCDLPDGDPTRDQITVVPINIVFDTEEFLEGETIDPEGFYAKVAQTGIVPKTSQPSPAAFEQVYRALAAQGAATILSLHVTGKLSGTVASAELAAQAVSDLVDVRVFDSLAGSAALGLMLREAAAMLAAGADGDAILARWTEIRAGVGIFFYLDSLKYARMSGRVGALQLSLASLLSIKPLVSLDDGLLDVAERVRSRRAALERLIALARTRSGDVPVNLAVVHAADEQGARALMAQANESFDIRESYVASLAPSLVTNLGIGTLGIVLYPANPQPETLAHANL